MAYDPDQEPQSLGPIVEGLFRQSQQGPALTVNRLRQHWASIVGEPLAKATYPTRLRRGVLWIAAPDSGWAFNLQFVKADVLNAVRTFLGTETVREVRFKVGSATDTRHGEQVAPEKGRTGAEEAAEEVTVPGDATTAKPEHSSVRTLLNSLEQLQPVSDPQSPLLSHKDRPTRVPHPAARAASRATPSNTKDNPASGEAGEDPAAGNPLSRIIARMSARVRPPADN